MSDIEDKTYIYVLGQFDNGVLMFSESFKIGKADDLKQRFQAYKNNPMCINPKYIRVIEKYKKHHVPDKPLLSFLDEFYEPLIVRKSKLRELCSFKGQEALDLFDDIIKRMPGIIKYYTDPLEIQELVERESIIKEVMNDIIKNVISENEDIVSVNTDVTSLEISDNVIERIKSLVNLGAYNKWEITGKNKPDQYHKYFKDKNISIIANYIPDIDQFLRVSENPSENKEELQKIIDITLERIRNDEKNKMVDAFPGCIVNIIKDYYVKYL